MSTSSPPDGAAGVAPGVAGSLPAKLPADALVILIGPSGAGKTSWARRHFPPGEVLSSDDFRALVSGDPGDQTASGEAFGVLHAVLRARTRRGLRCVVDATNLASAARRAIARVGARSGRATIAVAFDVSLERCLAWNATRPGRQVPARVVRLQHARLAQVLTSLAGEGYSAVYVLHEDDLVGGTIVDG